MENNFGIPKEVDKYGSSLDVLQEFGGYDGLKKAVAEKMKDAKNENIQIGSDDFVRFVLGYLGEDIKKENVKNIMKETINGLVAEIEESEKLGIKVADSCGYSGLRDCGKDKAPKVKEKKDPLELMSDHEYFLAFGKRRGEDDETI